MKSICRLAVSVALAAFVAFPACAQRAEKIASGRGDLETAAACAANTLPCMSVTPTGANTAEFVSLNSSDTTLNSDLDLFKVLTTSSVTFQLNPGNAGVGTFICGDQFSPPPVQFDGFCTNLVNPDILNPTAGFVTDVVNGNQVTFSFLSNPDLPSGWTFFSDPGDHAFIVPGGSTTVPEPASLALLACGLLAMFGAKRLRTQS
jgi:PEP-CTERM motif